MAKNRAFVVAIAVLLVTVVPLTKADNIDCRTGPGCLNGTDFFDWGDNYGLSLSPVPNGSIATSNGGVNAEVNFATGGNGLRADQGNGWTGNFSPGDELLLTENIFDGLTFNGPLSFLFDTALSGVGANIQTNFFGDFTALLEAFDGGNTLIGSYSKPGNSTGDGDGSAIFIGLGNIPGIESVIFSITACSEHCEGFAINQLDIVLGDGGPAPIPEPGTLLLLGTGLAGLARFRKKKSAV